MSIHYGILNTENKVDLSAIEKRLKALETLTSSHTTSISTNKASISTNANDITGASVLIQNNRASITSNKSEIDANYIYSQSINTKAVANGDKLLTKVSHIENFTSIFESLAYDTVQYPTPHRTGHPIGWLPVNHVNDTTKLVIDFHIFDMDTDLSSISSLNIVYRLDVAKQSGNAVAHTFPQNNLKSSSKKITHQMYNPRVSIDFKTAFPTIYTDIKVFRVVFTLKTSGITGNESRLYFHVKSF